MQHFEPITRDILATKVHQFEEKVSKINERLKGAGLPKIEIKVVGTSQRPIDVAGRGTALLPITTIAISRQASSQTTGLVQVLAKSDLNPALDSVAENAATHRTYGTLTEEERQLVQNPPNPRACDHCNSNRPRSYIYTLKTESGLMRVGGGCLKEFVGFDMPRWATALNDVIEAADKFTEITFREQEENQIVPIRVFLAFAHTLIQRDGYRNRDYDFSTGMEAMTLAREAVAAGAEREELSDTPIVDDLVAFIKTSIHRSDVAQNDYFVNLRTLADVGYLTYKQANLVASAPQAYANYQIQLARQAAELAKQQGNSHIGLNFVGKIKDRTLLEDLKVVFTKAEHDDRFGSSTRINFVDPKGNYFSWKASGVIEVEVGQTLQVLGTITRHDTYFSKTYGREIKDNKISRCSFLTPEEVLETKAKLEKAEARARKREALSSPAP